MTNKTLSDCMIWPSDPCKGYKELYKEVNRLREGLETLKANALKRRDYYNTNSDRSEEHLEDVESAFWDGKAEAESDIADDLTKLLNDDRSA